MYCLVPWLWNKPLYSLRLVAWHYWIATIGIVLYITSMWVAGIMQGLMWRAYTSLGFLQYSFVETVEAMHPFYVIRAIGGLLFLLGALIMVYNLWRTVYPRERDRSGRRHGACRIRGSLNVNHCYALAQTLDPRAQRDPAAARHPDRDRDRRHGGSRAAVLSEKHDRDRDRACAPTRRSSRRAATSMCARAATSATPR